MHLSKVNQNIACFHPSQISLMPQLQPAIFLSILLFAPDISFFTNALPSDVNPRSTPSKIVILDYIEPLCDSLVGTKSSDITQDDCLALTTTSQTSVLSPGTVLGYASGRAVGGDNLAPGAECHVNWYRGLICVGLPIGTSETVATGPQAGPCVNFRLVPDIYIPPAVAPTDLSNPSGTQGAYSAKLTCK